MASRWPGSLDGGPGEGNGHGDVAESLLGFRWGSVQRGVESTVKRGQGPGAGHSSAGSTCDFGSNLASMMLLLQLGNLGQNQALYLGQQESVVGWV